MSKAVLREREEGAEDKHCDRADRTNPTTLIFLAQKKNTQKHLKNAKIPHHHILTLSLIFF